LHEVFDYPFQEIAEIIGKSPANCRQIFRRAKQRITERRPRFTPSPEVQQQLIIRFFTACQSGNLPALTEMLAHDVISWSDGGGKVSAALHPIFGRSAVTRLCLGLVHKLRPTVSITIEEINGSPAALIWDAESLLFVAAFNVVNEQIQGLYGVLNPNKLAYLQRQLATRQNTVSHEGGNNIDIAAGLSESS